MIQASVQNESSVRAIMDREQIWLSCRWVFPSVDTLPGATKVHNRILTRCFFQDSVQPPDLVSKCHLMLSSVEPVEELSWR